MDNKNTEISADPSRTWISPSLRSFDIEYPEYGATGLIEGRWSLRKTPSPFITFIIPSIGRDSLKDTLNSLLNLNDSSWNAIIIFDGITYESPIKDERIITKTIEKTGLQEHGKSRAGLVRNIGIEMAVNKYKKDCSKDCIKDSDFHWIGFVDDDDCLSPNYINNLKAELNIDKVSNFCKPEVVIFRMAYENGLVLPMQQDRNIILKKVGISFCINIDIAHKYKFDNHIYEDFMYLKLLQNNGHKIIISEYVSYFVKCKSYKEENIDNNINKNIDKNKKKRFPKILLNYEDFS